MNSLNGLLVPLESALVSAVEGPRKHDCNRHRSTGHVKHKSPNNNVFTSFCHPSAQSVLYSTRTSCFLAIDQDHRHDSMDNCTTIAEHDERRADVDKLPAMPTPPPTSPESEEQLVGPASPSASSEASTSSTTLNSEDDEKLLDAKVPAGQRISIYVQVFEEMLETVLERESYLFNDEEKDMLARFSTMSCMFTFLQVSKREKIA